MKCDVRHICILKKKWQMVVFLCGSSLQSRQQFLNRVIYRADISAAFSVYFTKCTFLQLICWAGKGHHHQTFAKCKLGSPFSALPSNVELSFLKKLSCGLEMRMCYILFYIQNLDLVSCVHQGILFFQIRLIWMSLLCIYRYVGILKLDKGRLGCCQRQVVVYKTEDTSS